MSATKTLICRREMSLIASTSSVFELISFIGSIDKCHTSVFNALISPGKRLSRHV